MMPPQKSSRAWAFCQNHRDPIQPSAVASPLLPPAATAGVCMVSRDRSKHDPVTTGSLRAAAAGHSSKPMDAWASKQQEQQQEQSRQHALHYRGCSAAGTCPTSQRYGRSSRSRRSSSWTAGLPQVSQRKCSRHSCTSSCSAAVSATWPRSMRALGQLRLPGCEKPVPHTLLPPQLPGCIRHSGKVPMRHACKL